MNNRIPRNLWIIGTVCAVGVMAVVAVILGMLPKNTAPDVLGTETSGENIIIVETTPAPQIPEETPASTAAVTQSATVVPDSENLPLQTPESTAAPTVAPLATVESTPAAVIQSAVPTASPAVTIAPVQTAQPSSAQPTFAPTWPWSPPFTQTTSAPIVTIAPTAIPVPTVAPVATPAPTAAPTAIPEPTVAPTPAATVIPSEAEKYYKEISDIVSVTSAKNSANVPTEGNVAADMENRGFNAYPVTYNYDMDGKYSSDKETVKDSSGKSPKYDTYYVSSNNEVWAISVINGKIFANPVSFNLGSNLNAELLVSESDTITGYDSESNQFYEVKPYESAVILKTVTKIDAETLDKLTVAELNK